MKLRLFTALVAVLAASAVCCLPTANAGELTFHSCYRGGYGEASSAAGWYSNYFVPPVPMAGMADCPANGVGFNTSVPVLPNSPEHHAYMAFGVAYGPVLKTVSMAIEGGDTSTGMAYWISGCPSGCPVIAAIPPANADGSPRHLTVDMNGATAIYVHADCGQDTCAASDPLKIYNVEAIASDTTPPVFARFFLNVDGWLPPEIYWTSADGLSADFQFQDLDGFGMSGASAQIDDNAPFWYSPPCHLDQYLAFNVPMIYSVTGLCPKVSDSFKSTVPLKGLPDGPHKLLFKAEDTAGNKLAPYSVGFKLDGTAPGVPEDGTITNANNGGWIANDQANITWKNIGEVLASATQSGLSRLHYDLDPLTPGLQDPPEASLQLGQSGWSWPNYNTLTHLPIPADGRWALYLWTEDAAGNVGGRAKLKFGRDSDVPSPPQLGTLPWLPHAALDGPASLPITHVANASVESGNCGYAVSINATPNSVPATSVTNDAATTAIVLPPSLADGTNWVHAREISCAGLASDTVSAPVRVDTHPPQVEISGVPAATWSNKPFDVVVTAHDTTSGVASVEHAVGNAVLSSTPSESYTYHAGEGERKFKFSATDIAGNSAPIDSRDLRVDSTAPIAAFEPPDPAAPTELHATAKDALSGLDTAEIEYRRIDPPESDWHPLPTAAQADPADPAKQQLQATIPDAQLAEGVYALRIVSSDVAGNVAQSDLIAGSDSPMRVTLPLRASIQLTAGIATYVKRCVTKAGRACVKGSRCDGRPTGKGCRSQSVADIAGARRLRTIGFKVKAALTGELRDAAGNPLPGRSLKIYSAENGLHPAFYIDATTAQDGRYLVPLPAGPSTEWTVRYAGGATIAAAQASASEFVKAGGHLTVSDATPRVGQRVVFKGRVKGSATTMPKDVLVALEFWNVDHWQNAFARTRTDRFGNFQAGYRFTKAAPGVTVVKVRAVIEARNSSWPYETGPSNSLTLRVSG